MSKKYKAIQLDFDYFALINKDEILLIDDYKITNRKNPILKPKPNQTIDIKSWKIGFANEILSRDELSKIWLGFNNLGF